MGPLPGRAIPRTRRVLALAAAGGAAALALAGCHVPGTTAAGAPPGSSLTVAAVPGVGDAPLYIAQQDGQFARANLTVHIRTYPSMTGVMSAVRAGRASVGVGDYADIFYAQHQCGCLKVVADGYTVGPHVLQVMVLPGSPVATPQQLQGKTIGTAAPQLIPDQSAGSQAGAGVPFSMDTVAGTSVLEDNHVSPGQVTWQPMPANQLVGALDRHLVDAILVGEPQIFQAERRLGAVSVLDAATGATVGLPLDGYFTTARVAKSHGAALLAFRSVLQRAQAAAVQTGPVQAQLARFPGWNKETAALVSLGSYPASLNAGNLQRVVDLMASFGTLPSQGFSVSRMILH